MKIVNLSDYESFSEFHRKYESKSASDDIESLLLLFVASDDPETKEPWCSDCRNSKPIIDQVVKKFQFNEHIILTIVQVGNRDEWKDDDNPFRLHAMRISAVPTLLSVRNGMRLVESECADAAKVSHLFSNSL